MWSQGSHGFILTKFGRKLPFLATHRSLQIYQHLVTGGHIWSHMVTMVIWVWYHLATGCRSHVVTYGHNNAQLRVLNVLAED